MIMHCKTQGILQEITTFTFFKHFYYFFHNCLLASMGSSRWLEPRDPGSGIRGQDLGSGIQCLGPGAWIRGLGSWAPALGWVCGLVSGVWDPGAGVQGCQKTIMEKVVKVVKVVIFCRIPCVLQCIINFLVPKNKVCLVKYNGSATFPSKKLLFLSAFIVNNSKG